MRRLTDYLTTRGKSVLAAGIVMVLAGMALGVVDLSRIGVLCIALPVLAALLTRHHDLGITVERTVRPSRVPIDSVSTVDLAIANPGPRRTPLIMAEEHVDYALGDRPRFVVPSMRAGERRVLKYTVRSHTRGRHRIGPLAIRVRDPFGLSLRAAAHTGHTDVLVLPRVVPLTPARAKGSELGAEGTIPHMVALHGEDDVSIREYRDGDDLRRIHWPATARTGEIMVRQEDRPATRRATVLLDSRASRHRGSGTSATFEWSVTAVASVICHLLDLGYAVHLLTPRADVDARIHQNVDEEDALDTLAEVTTTGDEALADVLRAASGVTASGGLVVAVVASMGDDDARALAALRQPGSNGLAFVVRTGRGARSGSEEIDGAAEATAAVLVGAGWSVLVVDAHAPLDEAWRRVSGGERQVVAG
ncbi:putative membrane protein [Nostocoides japonicum T1-X7]|uniref:Putative membrane protein n=1 Tax=Nostocoides japonicum T1-X7 TaxID=1194083 RepID=A0A077LWV8_9MICO|nr:DUF58 domain-containing protein [Tetrasphaera japonica]CCH77322.1 putative membrane protein [Tetrasphaera japonica T1-X7]